jgi:hypothetical protein
MKLRRWEGGLLLALLLAFAAQTLLASPQKSASFDEQYHVTAGYAYLRTGDFRLAKTHPPLGGMVAGLPLLLHDDINLPLEHPLWEQGNRYDFSDVFLWEANADPQGILVAARKGIVALGIVLLLALFFWGRRLLGAAGGFLVLALAAFDPNVIANSRIISTDLPLTVFFVLAAWRLWCWLEAGRWYDLLLAGLFGGLVMAAKYNGLLFWPVAAAGALLYAPGISGFRIAKRRWWVRLLGVLGAGLLGLGVLWGVYRFTWGVPQRFPLPVPLPAPFYWDNLWVTVGGLVGETVVKPDFLLGEVSTGGWWYYFPVAIAVKTPLPLLILLAAGILALARKREVRRQGLVWLPIVAFLLMGFTGVLTIGYRHMLPAVAFAILLAGNAADWRATGSLLKWPTWAPGWLPARLGALPGVLLVGWLIVSTLRIFPHQEAYFNALGGQWPNWSNILVDSNLDWGQDLPALAAVMDARGIDSVNLAYFGKAVPERYGVRYRPLPGYLRFMQGREPAAYNPYTPEPGWYAISATSLRLGSLRPETTELYAYFRALEPVDRAGYSIYLYQVPEPAAGTAVVRPVVVDTPVYEVPPADLGLAPETHAAVKWLRSGSSTVYPQGQDFVLPGGPHYDPVEADLGSVFTLRGYELDRQSAAPGAPLNITLFWEAGTQPMPQPAPARGEAISAFVHLVAGGPSNYDAGAQVAVADGWDVALRGLEPGDVIAQTFTLEVGPDVPPGTYTLLAGLYSPQDGSRLEVSQAGQAAGDYVTLGPLEIAAGERTGDQP